MKRKLCAFFTKLAGEWSVLWLNPSKAEFLVVFVSEASSVTGDSAVVALESASVHLFPLSFHLAIPGTGAWFSAEELSGIAGIGDGSLDAGWAELANDEVSLFIGFFEF